MRTKNRRRRPVVARRAGGGPEISRAAALEAGRRVLEAGLRQCARGKHVYKDPEAPWGPCVRCGREISRRARRDGKGSYKLNHKRIH